MNFSAILLVPVTHELMNSKIMMDEHCCLLKI